MNEPLPFHFTFYFPRFYNSGITSHLSWSLLLPFAPNRGVRRLQKDKLYRKMCSPFVGHRPLKGVGSGIKEYIESLYTSLRMYILQLLLAEFLKTLRFSDILSDVKSNWVENVVNFLRSTSRTMIIIFTEEWPKGRIP